MGQRSARAPAGCFFVACTAHVGRIWCGGRSGCRRQLLRSRRGGMRSKGLQWLGHFAAAGGCSGVLLLVCAVESRLAQYLRWPFPFCPSVLLTDTMRRATAT